VHAVPADSERFIARAPALDADEVFLDLEDGAADKELARSRAVEALRALDFRAATVAVRVNATDTPHHHRDLIALAERAGPRLDAVILPKVRTSGDVEMTDKLLTQLELGAGLETGRVGIEAQIEDAIGLVGVEKIASASPRLEALVFGPGDYSAAVGIPVTTIGGEPEGYPGDHLNYVYSRLLVAARAAGLQAIDGPYARVGDTDGLVARARLVRALGYDGKWTIHPSQIARVNEIFSPSHEQFERASAMLEALGRSDDGAALFDGEMIDEASRRMAERIVRTGLAAGMGGR
jgi:citrate lyase subunit beta/citryl-CoA lyase